MTKIAKVVVKLHSTDTLVDDPSWHFVFKSAAATNFGSIADVLAKVKTFHNTIPTGGSHRVCDYISGTIDRSSGASQLEVYDITAHLAGTAAGAPVALDTFTLNTPYTGTSDIPPGCAGVLSFRAPYGTDVEFGTGTRPRSRDRNRIYLGPLNMLAISYAGTGRAVLNPNFIDNSLRALHDLGVSIGTDSWVLQQWSKAGAVTKVPESAWMDTRVDYQRRRSDADPGSRTYFAMPSV